MKQIKILSVAVASLLILFCTTSWVSPKHAAASPRPVMITGWYDFSTMPGKVYGKFTTGGALNISGTSTMVVDPVYTPNHLGPNNGLVRAHCEVVLSPTDPSTGEATGETITIHQECVYVTPMPQGRWEIVSGTGIYTNLRGNGPLTMPMDNGLFGEAMTGSIF